MTDEEKQELLDIRLRVLDAKVDACLKMLANMPMFVAGATNERKGRQYWQEAAAEMRVIGNDLRKEITKIEKEYSNDIASEQDRVS